jgi:putative spermidine/putrescine transport system ATP-binding protein
VTTARDTGPSLAGQGARVRLVDLCKRYAPGLPPAVDHIQLDIAPGEFVTLLGPSGSGKTTTLNMIAGFVDITSGRIDLNGTDVSPIPSYKRNFGMVFQNYALFPHMTVYDNIAFPLKQRKFGATDIRRMVGQVLELVDLQGRGNRKPTELSGGQQQRVALARAVVFSPSLLLLDEPLGALDRKLRQGLQAEIKRIHRELGLTFVFVTHDQEEAMFLSDRIAVFNEGRIERCGTPSDLYQNPGTRFVAEFLGESNVFSGGVSDGVYRWGENRWALPDGAGTDDRQTLIVRPERLDVLDGATKVPPGLNSTSAVVTNVGFLGTVRRIELRYDDESAGCAVLRPNAAEHVVPGSRVTVTWDPRDQALVSA